MKGFKIISRSISFLNLKVDRMLNEGIPESIWFQRIDLSDPNTHTHTHSKLPSVGRSCAGVVLEHHLEKTLTYLAFFKDSQKHQDFLKAGGS